MAEDTDIKYYKAAANNDTGSNGGRMSANEVTSNSPSNLFAAVGGSELAAGSVKYRKMFAQWAAENLTLSFVKAFIDKYTQGDDRVTFIAATQTNTQSAITGSEKEYGCGKLDQNVIATATELDILVEDGTDHTFEDGDLIRITDKTDVDDESGNEEYVTIDGTPTVDGDVVTIEFTPALEFGYAASASRVMNVYEPGDLVASFESFVVTSTAGTFDDEYLLPNNIGAVEQNITITFTGATTFTISGNTLGSLGSGNIGAGASPNNADFDEPYFVMQSAGFGGTFESGDVITFTLHPSSFGVFFKKTIPAATSASTPNKFTFALTGETPPE